MAQQVALLRTKITSLSGNSYGYGHSPSGYKISMGSWLRTTNTWESVVSHASDTISKLTIDIDKPLISNYIDDNGFFYTLVYSDPSDGKTATKVVTDYTNVVFTMEISANEYIQSMMAANHVENLATQDEAETGEDNTKTMTPLRVFQSIAQWTKNKFVSKTEDETVLGAKNFKNGLQINGRNVLSQSGEKVVDHTSATDSSIQSGTVRLIRYGDFLIFNFNFQCRSSNINSGGNLIGAIEPDFIPAYSIQVSLNDNKSLTIDSSGKVTALWGLDANKYYVGSAMVIAKNKL